MVQIGSDHYVLISEDRVVPFYYTYDIPGIYGISVRNNREILACPGRQHGDSCFVKTVIQIPGSLRLSRRAGSAALQGCGRKVLDMVLQLFLRSGFPRNLRPGKRSGHQKSGNGGNTLHYLAGL